MRYTFFSVTLVVLMSLTLVASLVAGQTRGSRRSDGERWVVSWVTSMHGPYPAGNAVAQPVLDFAFESAESGANDQTFRLIVKPDLWGRTIRLHFANTFGTRAVTLDGVFAGLHGGAASVVSGTNQSVRFDNGRTQLRLEPGASAWSDPIALPFVTRADDPMLIGRKLAVSLHIVGTSGPMTWHAKALTTSYVSAPRSGSHGAEEDDAAFPFSTTSWFFLDAVDVKAPRGTAVIACFGDSITDGTASTMNGDDRWPDVLSRRMHAAYGRTRVSVVNAGIGGNRIIGPETYTPAAPVNGGPSALARLDRDVLGLSGLTAIVWLEGINDLGQGATAEAVIDGMKEVVRRVRAHGGSNAGDAGDAADARNGGERGERSDRRDRGDRGDGAKTGITLIGATITSSLGSTPTHGAAEVDARRKTINEFVRTSGLFDGVADFDAATRDDRTGALRPEFVPNSTIGGAGDRLHPNRAGYLAMGNAIDIEPLAPPPAPAAAATPRGTPR